MLLDVTVKGHAAAVAGTRAAVRLLKRAAYLHSPLQ